MPPSRRCRNHRRNPVAEAARTAGTRGSGGHIITVTAIRAGRDAILDESEFRPRAVAGQSELDEPLSPLLRRLVALAASYA